MPTFQFSKWKLSRLIKEIEADKLHEVAKQFSTLGGVLNIKNAEMSRWTMKSTGFRQLRKPGCQSPTHPWFKHSLSEQGEGGVNGRGLSKSHARETGE